MLHNHEISKAEVIAKSIRWWNPGKTTEWQDEGINFVMGKRDGYYIYDMEGKELMDVHLNGGTYSLGHRNPEIVQTLRDGLDLYDIGNHHFPSITRAELAEALAEATPEGLRYSIYASGGGEAVDVALKCARYSTGRKKIVSIEHCYHGHTGLAVSTGDELFSRPFLCDGAAGEFVHVPFNDLEAMRKELSRGDAACVIMETIPATYGFPIPRPGYLKQVKELCAEYGALYIADEVQTGLMRTGELWGITLEDVVPDILITSKGFSGGIYPIAATVVNEAAGKWLLENGHSHMSTFGGSELGCLVALKVLEICQRPETRANVKQNSQHLRRGLEAIKQQHEDFLVGIRQRGLVMGLVFNHPEGAKHVMHALYQNGVWAIYSMLDPRVLQFKPGVLCDTAYCDKLLNRLETGISTARQRCLA